MKKLLLLLVLFCSSAFASFAPVPTYSYSYYSYSASGFFSVSAACSALGSTGYNFGAGSTVIANAAKTNCDVRWDDGSLHSINTIGVGASACPSNSIGTSSCVCNSGFDQSGSACVAHVVTPAEVCGGVTALAGGGFVKAGSVMTLHMCSGGQSVRGDFAAMVDGVNMVQGPFVCDGTPCTVGVSGAVAPSAVAAGVGVSPSTCSGFWGQVNGKDVCIARKSTIGTAGATAATSATSTTTGGVTTGSASSGQTVCDGVNCTTTTTTTPMGGGAAVTQSETKPQENFCASNPLAAQCQPVDPCKDSTKAGCAELGSSTAPAFGNVDSGFSSITSVLFTSSNTCPPDLSVSVLGRPIHFSYAAACSTLNDYIKPILLILAAGAAAFIFVSGFKS